MFFNQDIKSNVKFTRLDKDISVNVIYNLNSIKPLSTQRVLMQKIMQGKATAEDKKKFGKAWQDRVRRIFENSSNLITIF
jgi:hypothetical protein